MLAKALLKHVVVGNIDLLESFYTSQQVAIEQLLKDKIPGEAFDEMAAQALHPVVKKLLIFGKSFAQEKLA